MKLIVDSKYPDIGINAIVAVRIYDFLIGELNEETQALIGKSEELVLGYPDRLDNPIISGYQETIKKIGRSLRKFPPSAEALISNIKRRGSFMRINPLVDIYNSYAVRSFLSIGAHDLSKVKGDIHFTFATGGEDFHPIGGGVSKAIEGDFIYKDNKGIMAFLDARDSEDYKIDRDSEDIILIVQGNANTSTGYRKEALRQIAELIVSNFGGTYDLIVTKAEEED